MQSENAVSCKQAKCNVAKDGKCLEGLPLKECPHISWIDSIDVTVANTEVKKVSGAPQVLLSSGEEWNLKNVSELTNQYQTKRIYIIGDSDCGKTTLLIKLFNLFQLGRFGKYQFAGSTTLIGFERRIHLTKMESKSTIEQTEKTKSQEFNFLHLEVKTTDVSERNRTHLLLSDISGEKLQFARDSSTDMKELKLLQNADFVLITLDGAKLSDRKLKMSTILNGQTFLRQALDDGMITAKSKVRILISKWDLLHGLNDFNYESNIVEPFQKTFGSRIPDFKFQRICARTDKTDEVNSIFGIEELLNDWTTEDPIKVINQNFSPKKGSERAFSNYFVSQTQKG